MGFLGRRTSPWLWFLAVTTLLASQLASTIAATPIVTMPSSPSTPPQNQGLHLPVGTSSKASLLYVVVRGGSSDESTSSSSSNSIIPPRPPLTPSRSFWSRIFLQRQQPSPPSYRQVLEDHIGRLEIQLRQSQDQLVVLKQQQAVVRSEQRALKRCQYRTMKKNKKNKNQKVRFVVMDSTHNNADEDEAEAATAAAAAAEQQQQQLVASYEERLTELERRLEEMQLQVTTLERLKMELDELLQAATLKIQSLEQELAVATAQQEQQQQESTRELESKHKEAQAHYEALIADLQAKLQAAAEAATRYEALQESNLLQKQQQQHQPQQGEDVKAQALAEFEVRLQQVRSELEQAFAKELALERQRGQIAVDAEKQKMRKLVKALALREKKLLKQAHKEQKKLGRVLETTQADLDEATAMIGSSSTTAQQQQREPKTPPTTRGFR